MWRLVGEHFDGGIGAMRQATTVEIERSFTEGPPGRP